MWVEELIMVLNGHEWNVLEEKNEQTRMKIDQEIPKADSFQTT